MTMPIRRMWATLLIVMMAALCLAQDAPRPLSAQQRMLAAKKICFEPQGARIPFDVISEAFKGWGRYTIVYEPAEADLIVVIQAPTLENGLSVNGRGAGSVTVMQVRLAVLDAHDRVTLWQSVERPKGARKESERDEHVVDSSLAVFRRFRQVIEPEP
jgi:hypothetical protein